MNLTDPILRYGRMQPTAAALLEGEETISYGTLSDVVLRTAQHLADLGIQPGDQVGLCLKDDVQHVIALLAVLRLGATAVQMDWRSRGPEKARIATAFALKRIITLPDGAIEAGCPSIPVDSNWHSAIQTAQPLDMTAGDWNAPAAVLASSGTTGLPKFTMATHLQLYLHAIAYLEIVPPSRQRFLATLPHYFSAGRLVLLAHLMRGDTIVLHPSLFTAAEYVRAVSRHKVTAGFIVPSVVRQLFAISEPGKPLFPDLEVLICGGAPLFPDEKRDAVQMLTPNFHEMYGAAAIGPLSALRPRDLIEHPTSVGRPFLLVEVDVVDDGDRPLGPGIPGRLRCRGLGLTSPIGVPGAPPSAADFRDGWHYPGEIAALDESGYIQLQGRSSEVIFRGGAKIFPAEVEAALQAHDAIAEAAVVGRDGPDQQQQVVAYVVARRQVAPGELLAHCRTQLTAFKVPQEIHVVPDLPRNASGKLDKRALLAASSSA